MLFKLYRYTQDLRVKEGEALTDAAEQDLIPPGEYFAINTEEGMRSFTNGALLQVRPDRTVRFIRIA